MQPLGPYSGCQSAADEGHNNSVAPGAATAYTANPQNSYDATKLFFAVAAAASYSQISGVSNQLGLQNMIVSNTPDAASAYASRYQAAYQVAAYQHPYYNDYQQLYANSHRSVSAFQPTANYGFQQNQQHIQPQQQRSQMPQYSSNCSLNDPKSAPRTSTSSRKNRKRRTSDSDHRSDLKKREECDGLFRARTDKLMSEAPLFIPINAVDGITSSSSSCQSMQNSGEGVGAAQVLAVNNSRLLRAILDDKIRFLMLRPSVRKTFASGQAMREAQKRSSETFAVKLHSGQC